MIKIAIIGYKTQQIAANLSDDDDDDNVWDEGCRFDHVDVMFDKSLGRGLDM